jgi:predicted transcriptional regulator YdeE
MEYKIINLPSFNFIGLPIRTTNENNQAMRDIGPHWQKFMSENMIEKIPSKADSELLGLYTDYEGDFMKPYTFIIGCRVSDTVNVPDGMAAKVISVLKYAVFTGKGKLPDIVPQTWMKIWNSDIERAYRSDFEVYGIKASNREDAEIDIYISIK